MNIQDYFQCFITPIIISKEEKKNEVINALFFPKIFKFDANYSVREMYFYIFLYYRKLFKDIKSFSYENFLKNLKENNLHELNKEFTEYFNIKESTPFKLHIINNVPKKDKFSCEYCNRSCNYCSFNFKLNESLIKVKKSQKIKRPFLIYLEVLNYSEKKLCDKIVNNKDFAKDLLIKIKEINIYDFFEAFRTEEKLEKENSWYCSNCKKNQEALKKLEIYRAPNILIVQLKRFDCKTENIYEGLLKNKKNESLVVFPIEGLDSNTAFRTTETNLTRFYTNWTITITSSGKPISSVDVACDSASYATALANSSFTSGTAVASEKVVTVEGINASSVSVLLGAQVRASSFTIYF